MNTPSDPRSPFKSHAGLRRVWNAMRYSLAGLRAAVRHESAFRQELALGLPMVLLALWLAPGRWQLLAMVGAVVLVWIVELLNSAVEAAIDRIGPERHDLSGRAKDVASAAVWMSLVLCAAVWGAALWARVAA